MYAAFFFIELGEALAKPVHFDPHYRVLAFLEVFIFAKDIHSDRVFRDVFSITDQRGSANVSEQLAEPRRLPETARPKNASKLVLYLRYRGFRGVNR